MRILSWNILQGGGRRLDGTLEALGKHQADVVALQEFRHGKSKSPLINGLSDLGLTHHYTPTPESDTANTVALFSYYPLQETEVIQPKELPGSPLAIKAKLSLIDSEASDISIVTVHLPHKKQQLPYFQSLSDLPKQYRNEHTLMIGDYNCGIPFEDSETKTFYATQQFQNLLAQGWIDTWRSRNNDAKEFTWISARTGNGFRYDHALASSALNERITEVSYDHSVREAGYSDHSIMIVDIDT